MNKKTLLYALTLLLFLSYESQSQNQDVSFNLITGTNSVPIGKINAGVQDKYGFMWFSDQTNRSIIRYDGSNMTRYAHDQDNPNSLGGYYPETIVADSSGAIWIGFYGQGLDRFDLHTNTFTHYTHDPNDPESLAHSYVSAILIDKLGKIWVGTNDGLDLLNPVTGKFTHYKHDPDDPTSLSGNIVRTIYEDQEGTIWVGTGFPFDLDIQDGGLNRLDRDTDTFKRYLNDPDNPQSILQNKVRAIFEDGSGNFWVGSQGNGLHLMDRATGEFKRFPYDPDNPQKLSAPMPTNEASHITFISEDVAGYLWIGTNNSGINRYNPVSGEITHYGNDADNSGSYMDNSGWWIYPTEDGHMWMGNEQSNLYKIDIYNNQIPRIEEDVLAIFEESPSVVWKGSQIGLIREDLKSGTTQVHAHDPNNSNSLSSNHVNAIYKDNQGIFWFGTGNGLNRYDPDSGLFTRYTHSESDSTSLSDNDISTIYEDTNANLWMGTYGGGLEMFNRKSGQFEHYTFDLYDINSISGNYPFSIIEDQRKDLWIGYGFNIGVDRFDRSSKKFYNYLTGLIINSSHVDSDGGLWFGSQNGLHKYDYDTKKFIDFDINAAVGAIIEDDDKNLWLGASSGIFKLNPETEYLIKYGQENGIALSERFYQNASKKMADGKIILDGHEAYYSFYPSNLKTFSDTSRLYFTNLWLNGVQVSPNEKGPMKKSIFETDELTLKHDQNVFSLSFTEIDFRSNTDNKMSYLLEGYDPDWRPAAPEEMITYFKIPTGNYTFRIKATNNGSGITSERSIQIRILSPWWFTWWAYIIYGLVFAGGVFFVDRFQRKRLLTKAAAAAKEKELTQAREIEKAYNELKITQNQLIQSEKMASLGELTAGIAHEIQNPLNFVNNFSDVNTELVDELITEIDKGDLEEAKTIANDLKDNEKKIVHHGKRAEEIVRSMLQHSRGTSDKKELTDINKLADEYLRLAFHGLRAKDKSFNSEFLFEADEALALVNVVPQDIGRVLLNLINNAFHAVAKAEKPQVIVRTKQLPDTVEISVSDNGSGIPDDIKEKIFQPFFTTKPTGEGTGLGLSMSYDIITKGHGGEITVEATEGQGTTFSVSIPSSK